MGECKRNTQPWQSHPTRMLRHKTLIQCARLAFGFAGIFDQDEAERVIEGSATEVHVGHESDDRRPELIAKGESAARLGTVKYQEFWVALSAEEKQVIGAVENPRLSCAGVSRPQMTSASVLSFRRPFRIRQHYGIAMI